MKRIKVKQDKLGNDLCEVKYCRNGWYSNKWMPLGPIKMCMKHFNEYRYSKHNSLFVYESLPYKGETIRLCEVPKCKGTVAVSRWSYDYKTEINNVWLLCMEHSKEWDRERKCENKY